MSLNLPSGVQINAPIHPRFEEILTHDALAFVAKLHRTFAARRKELLAKRVERQAKIDAGEMPDFLPETKHIREGDWKVAPLPKALECRRVEITGPVERKMLVNALNSGARVFMGDFEDASSPGWANMIEGQITITPDGGAPVTIVGPTRVRNSSSLPITATFSMSGSA